MTNSYLCDVRLIMITFHKSIQWHLSSSVIFSITSIIQLLVNVYYERIGFIILFIIFTLITTTYTTILWIDIITKDTKKTKVTILEHDKQIIKVLTHNGKIRKIKLPKEALIAYQLNHELQLTLTKRTRLIKDITVL